MAQLKSLKIKDKLYLNALSVDVPKAVENKVENDVVNQFLIFDRSGSMSSYLDDVVDSAVKYCSLLPDGSSVSVGYFSGTDEYNLSVPYTLKKETSGVITTLNSYRSAISLTNFIQILDKVNETAAKISGKSALFFFTDGCHNTGGSRTKLDATLKEWSQFASISMFVGYGYIDREMMSSMAQACDGSFIHLNDFNNFNRALRDFGLAVEDSSPHIDVHIDVKDTVPISLSGKSIIEYTLDEKGFIKYKPSKKGFKGVFFLTNNLLAAATQQEVMDTTLERGLRSLATIYSQKNEVGTALDLLAFIGDKYLISNLYNSIAPDEFSEAEEKIRQSVFYPKERFVEGVVTNFLPPNDAFCVLDAIFIMNEDENAKLFLDDKDFSYERIGKKTAQQDGPNPIKLVDEGVSINNISFHKERLNVSISTESSAIVTLDPEKFKLTSFSLEELSALNIPIDYKVKQFRNYSIIADGRLQTKKLVVGDLSKTTIKKLGPVISLRPDSKYIIDFTKVPLINKTYVKLTSAKILAENIWQEKLLTDKISVYNAVKKQLESELGTTSVKHSVSISEVASKFLVDKCYIKNGSYNPPVKAIAGEDQYEAYAFSIDIKGFSKASASEVIKKVDKGSKTTQREALLVEAYKAYVDAITACKNSMDKLELVLKELSFLNKELSKIRHNIQISKFAIVIGNKGKMDEFPSRDNMNLPLDVKSAKETFSATFEFSIEKTIVKI